MTDKDNSDQAALDRIKAAVKTVGKEDPDDYLIKPTRFSELYTQDAPAFADVLANAALAETARRYEQKDTRALQDQKKFKALSFRATWAVFTATVTAAVLTGYASSPAGDAVAEQDPLALVLGLITLFAGAYAAMLAYQISGGGYLSRWMSARASAETERLGYFNRLIDQVTKTRPKDHDILLLSLELFRRYQLALQQVFYTQRGSQHRASMDTTLKLGSMAAGILALCSGGAGILGFFEPTLLSFAAVGILGSALATVASRREEINQDERNAERYGRTADILSHLRERHTEVQHAVAAGNTDVLIDYVAAVHEQLSLEHRQWQAQAEAIESAVNKLASSLEEHATQAGQNQQD